MTAVSQPSYRGAAALWPDHHVRDSSVESLLAPGTQVLTSVRATADATHHPHTAHVVLTPLRGGKTLDIESSFLAAASVGSGHHHSVARGIGTAFTGTAFTGTAFTGADDGHVRGAG